MEINLYDKPYVINGLYTDYIDDYVLYYNPIGHGGVTVADNDVKDLINVCDGKKTIEQIIQLFNNANRDDILCSISALIEKEVLALPEITDSGLEHYHKHKSSISCWVHLTNECNLACSYCYIHKSKGSMSLSTGMVVIDKLIQTCLQHGIPNANIKFAGGEPLLQFKLLKQLISYSKSKNSGINFSYTILTNGILISESIAKYIKEYKIGVAVSLDGLNHINDICRYDKKKNGSFDSVIKGLDILKQNGIKPTIMTTVSTQNYKELLNLTKFLLDGEFHFRFSLERDCETGNPDLLNNIDELLISLIKCYDYIEQNLPNEDFLKIHTFCDVNFNRPSKKSCGAGDNFFAIGHNGDLGVCGLGLSNKFASLDKANDLLGYVRENSNGLASYKASSCSSCRNCTWINSCAGGCSLQTHSTYGTFCAPSPYCEVYKIILPKILRIKGLQMIKSS